MEGKEIHLRGKYLGEGDELYCINGKEYDIIGEEDGYYRVVDETDEDFLYEKDMFEIVKVK